MATGKRSQDYKYSNWDVKTWRGEDDDGEAEPGAAGGDHEAGGQEGLGYRLQTVFNMIAQVGLADMELTTNQLARNRAPRGQWFTVVPRWNFQEKKF